MRLLTPFRFFLFLVATLGFAILGTNNTGTHNAALAASEPGAAFSPGNDRIKVRLLVDHESIQPTDSQAVPSARIGVLLQIEDGWHTYWKNSGEAAIPTNVTWRLPQGWSAGPLQWPAPTRFLERGSIITYGYRKEVLLWSELFAPQIIPEAGQMVDLGVKVSWLVCKETCVPGQQAADIAVPFSTSNSLQPSAAYPIFAKYKELSPQPLSALKKSPHFANSTLDTGYTALESNGAFGEGKFGAFGLQLKGLATTEKSAERFSRLEAQVQVFPYTGDALMFRQAEAKFADGSAILRVPAKITGAAATGAAGIVVLSPELTGFEHEFSFEWSQPIKTDTGDAVFADSTGFAPATYRTYATEAFGGKGNGSAKVANPIPQTADYSGLLQALLAAFIAGMILNLMPCVLPIVSIKIMGFLKQADQSRKTVVISSISFAAGILSSFLVLALILISLRSVGYSLGWGFQFQYPQFVAALLLIVFFLSLGLFDFFAVTLPFMQNANDAASKVRSPLLRHFFDGVLATALSTPCTAPVLGTALVFAFAQPPFFTILIFLTIGLGLATPYVYCSTHPSVLNRLPQPGAWMFHFRQVMGFLLLGTCVWLMSVLHDLTEKGAVWASALMLFFFFLLWVRKTAIESRPERGRSLLLNGTMVALLLAPAVWVYPDLVSRRGQPANNLIPWVPFSESVLSDAASAKRPVFIDFTASWCITCKFNEFRVIETKTTAEAMKRLNVLPVKGDWTSGDESITAALKRFGAEGVPLYVVLPASGSEPIVLSTLPSLSTLLEALEKGSKS